MALIFKKTEAKIGSFTLPEKGPYVAKVTNAEVKQPADPAKHPYLSLAYEICDRTGVKKGMIFDILSTSPAEFCTYRLGRFMDAIGLTDKEFNSYEDICKVAITRQLGFFICEDNSQYVKDNPDKARMIIDTKNDGIYFNVNDIKTYMPEPISMNSVSAPVENTNLDDIF